MSTDDFSSKTVKQNMTRGTGKLNLRTAEQERVRLTAAQQKQIQRLYENAAKEVAKQAEQAPRVPSDALRKQYLNQLQNQLNGELDKIRAEIESTVKDNMKKTAVAVVGDNINFLKEVGLPVQGAFSHVPDEVVRAVATGQIYEGKWSLSRAIWKNTRRTQKDVQSVIAQGIALNKSAYDIAKDLEKYVDPSSKKDWDWSKVYPGTAKKVDYNAQRLARTMVSHAYQQSFVRTTQKNPFVSDYIWHSSGSRPCELCQDRDGKHFEKGSLPLDHPNGMCTFEAVLPSMDEVADRIADWYRGYSDEQLDDYASTLSVPQTTKKSHQSEITPLVPGKYSAEITDSVSDYFLPQSTRNKLEEIQKLNSFDDFSKYFETVGITLDTDLKSLSGERRFDTIKPVKELCEKLAVGIDSYKQLYGDNALSKLNRILLYSDSLECTAAYNFNRIGENDPMAGTLEFRDWTSNGRDVFHELAHAFQDSNARPGEDAVSFSQRVVQQAGLNPNFNAYSGAAQDVIEAERFADAFGFGFYLGSKSGLEFIQSVQREFLKGVL